MARRTILALAAAAAALGAAGASAQTIKVGLILTASGPQTSLVLMNAAGSNIVTMSPYVVRTSFTLWQSSYPLGQWAAKTGGIKRAYTLVSDFGPGHDGEQGFVKGFTGNGGEIVASVRMPV